MTGCFTDSGLDHGIFLNSDISQGSAVTQLRCGEIISQGFVANLLVNLSVKEVWKLVNNWRSYWQYIVVPCFFLTHSVQPAVSCKRGIKLNVPLWNVTMLVRKVMSINQSHLVNQDVVTLLWVSRTPLRLAAILRLTMIGSRRLLLLVPNSIAPIVKYVFHCKKPVRIVSNCHRLRVKREQKDVPVQLVSTLS